MIAKLEKPTYFTAHCLYAGKKQMFAVEYLVHELKLVLTTKMESNDKWDNKRIEYYLN